jgi:hypothetical protein
MQLCGTISCPLIALHLVAHFNKRTEKLEMALPRAANALRKGIH